MKLRVLLAFILTVALLFVARKASMRQQPPIDEKADYYGLVLEHHSRHIFKGDNTDAVFTVEVEPAALPPGWRLTCYYRPLPPGEKHGSGGFESIVLQASAAAENTMTAVLPNQGRGREFEYFLELTDNTGQAIASIPAGHLNDLDSTLWLRFEGQQSIPLLVAHITGMFGGVFLAVLALFTALGNLGDLANRVRFGKQVLWVVIVIFLGTFPIGVWIEYQVYATYWTGFPLGRDITDSKGLVVFLFWLLTLILVKGSAFSGKPERDLVGKTGIRIAAAVSIAVTLAAYLIPHSSGNF